MRGLSRKSVHATDRCDLVAHGHRHEQVGCPAGSGAREPWCGHADDREWELVHANHAAQNGRIAAEPALPEAAEAGVPYDLIFDLDEINGELPNADVALVIGANDVVNPVAETDPKSPIAGMPIIQVYKAHTVIVVKRSLSPGFAGIPNPLFAADNTLMFFSDGKKAVQEMTNAVKESS